jgi:hypothetical protein
MESVHGHLLSMLPRLLLLPTLGSKVIFFALDD